VNLSNIVELRENPYENPPSPVNVKPQVCADLMAFSKSGDAVFFTDRVDPDLETSGIHVAFSSDGTWRAVMNPDTETVLVWLSAHSYK
jgi:hypothetical protein